MSSVTEIYVCKLRQELKKGKLFTSGDIHNRQDAEQDARERCSHDDTIAKIGYYVMQDDGSFKSILLYENPDVDPNSGPSEEMVTSERDDLIAAAQQALLTTMQERELETDPDCAESCKTLLSSG